MAKKRTKLNNKMQEAFNDIYEDVNSLAYLATKESGITHSRQTEIKRIKQNLQQSIKAIEFFTTTQN